jgi:hypothetical protein
MVELIESKYHEANKMLLRLRREVTEKLDSSSSNASSQSASTTLYHRGSNVSNGSSGDDESSLHSLMVDINALSRKIADLDPLIAPLYAAKKQFWSVQKKKEKKQKKNQKSKIIVSLFI